MPKSSKRTRQIADMIQRYLAVALRQEIKDPRLVNVTITDVTLTADLRMAKVYFTLVKDQDLTAAQAALHKAAGHFRHIIAVNLELRFTPSLTFYYDETILHAERLSRLLNQAEKTDDPAKESE
jgi:ribosome-binding factor A